jgi:hypothetical protein
LILGSERGQVLFFAREIGDILKQMTLYLGCFIKRGEIIARKENYEMIEKFS